MCLTFPDRVGETMSCYIVHSDLTETHAQSHYIKAIICSPHSRHPELTALTKAMSIIKKVLINHLPNTFQMRPSQVKKI